MISTYDIEPQIEEQYDSTQEENLREMGTAYAEPANEDQYDMTDVEADANALASCGWGTDEDYGYYGE